MQGPYSCSWNVFFHQFCCPFKKEFESTLDVLYRAWGCICHNEVNRSSGVKKHSCFYEALTCYSPKSYTTSEFVQFCRSSLLTLINMWQAVFANCTQVTMLLIDHLEWRSTIFWRILRKYSKSHLNDDLYLWITQAGARNIVRNQPKAILWCIRYIANGSRSGSLLIKTYEMVALFNQC